MTCCNYSGQEENMADISESDLHLSSRLHEKYGELMSLREVGVALKFPTADSVRKALSRGTLGLNAIKIPNRRGLFVKTNDVIKFLQNIE